MVVQSAEAYLLAQFQSCFLYLLDTIMSLTLHRRSLAVPSLFELQVSLTAAAAGVELEHIQIEAKDGVAGSSFIQTSNGAKLFFSNAACYIVATLSENADFKVSDETLSLLDKTEALIRPGILNLLDTRSNGGSNKLERSVIAELKILNKVLGKQERFSGSSATGLFDVYLYALLLPVLTDSIEAFQPTFKSNSNDKRFKEVFQWFKSVSEESFVANALRAVGFSSIYAVEEAPAAKEEIFVPENGAPEPVVFLSKEAIALAALPAGATLDSWWTPTTPMGHTEYSWRKPEPAASKSKKKKSKAEANAAKGSKKTGTEKQKKKSKSAVPQSYADRKEPERRKFVPPPVKLPKKGGKNILITSALPYVNNVPHLGNIIGCVLSADVYARYCRLRDYNAIYICGTDEYGTATETKAIAEGLTPQQICDKYHKVHAEVYDWFDISFDKFGRTTTPQQTEIAQDIFLKNDANGNIVHQTMQQLWCNTCSRFLADRFVEGTCPKCGYDDARGDQCDSCSTLLNATELVNPKCKTCASPPVEKDSKHLFLDLPKLTGKLTEFVDESAAKGNWSQNSITGTRTWLKGGLQNRCITRDLKWGTPVPKEGYTDKVFYVWFDAPIGYLSITANYTKDWEKWWKNPEDVDLVQFMGKDNVTFHTIIFPSTLIGAQDNYTLLHHISTTEYLNYEAGLKFSKSRGTGVFGTDPKKTGIPSEVWRYYLLANRPETADTEFSWDDFAIKNNNELIANLGNFVNRILTFTNNSFGSVIPEFSTKPADIAWQQGIFTEVTKHVRSYVEHLEGVKIKDGLRSAMALSSACNKFIQENKPWELIKEDKEKCGTFMCIANNLVYLLAVLLQPYMPGFSDKVCRQLSVKDPNSLRLSRGNIWGPEDFVLKSGHKIGSAEIIFINISAAEVEKYRKMFGLQQEESKVEEVECGAKFLTARILSVEPHPSKDHLYVLKVDCGPAGGNERQIVSGLAKAYPSKDDLVGKNIVVMANIKASKFAGVQSQGMVMCAEDSNGVVGVLTTTEDAKPGVVIQPEGCSTTPAKNFNVKKNLPALRLKLGKGGVPLLMEQYKFLVDGKDILVADKNLGEGAIVR